MNQAEAVQLYSGFMHEAAEKVNVPVQTLVEASAMAASEGVAHLKADLDDLKQCVLIQNQHIDMLLAIQNQLLGALQGIWSKVNVEAANEAELQDIKRVLETVAKGTA